jgi:hypothetical protein
MKAPGDFRPGVWRGRILQVKVTNACDLDCKNCSVAVGLAKKLKKLYWMTPDQFRVAIRSLKGFPGVIGMFGGNPCIHPQFEELCQIFREEIPNKEQRGLWSNRLFGHGKVCRETFHGSHSNLNVHQVKAAWDEIKRDWPEGRAMPDGLNAPSAHGPIFGSMMELGLSETEMWDKVGCCFVNQTWSAEITLVEGKLLGYFCEVAATMAELTGDPSHGIAIEPGWWSLGMPAFEDQVQAYCTKCLFPLNARKVNAAGDAPEEFTEIWKPLFATIKGRPMKQVTRHEEIKGGEPATKYLPRNVLVNQGGMFTEGTVTVVTAATGHSKLARCIQSVQEQTYSPLEHWVVTDGSEREGQVARVLAQVGQARHPIRTVVIPDATGRNKWNGHRIYSAISFLVNSQFVCFLDEDNWFDPDHVQSLLQALWSSRSHWAFALRKICAENGKVVAIDNCESLGNLHPSFNVPNGYLIDTNCYFLSRELAVWSSALWYGPTNAQNVHQEPDRVLCRRLLEAWPRVCCNLKHTVNYTVYDRSDTVTAKFFHVGNEVMRKKFPAGLPWESHQGGDTGQSGL